MKPINNANFGKTTSDYATFRPGFPPSLFTRLETWGIGTGNQNIVDLGCGTGTLAQGFAQAGNQVIGVDPSEEMLSAARDIHTSAPNQVAYLQASAEDTGLDSESQDIVSAGQCWHWFDRQEAAEEIRRILKPQGVLVVAYFDWIPLSGNLVRETEKLIEQHNPAWRGGNQFGIHPMIFRDLGDAGYRNLESFTFDEDTPFTPAGWRGRIRASAGVGATMSPDEIEIFDSELEALMARDFPGEAFVIPHRIFALKANP